MFIARSLPATSRSRPKNGICLSFESSGSASRTSPGTAQSISWVASPPVFGRCAHANCSVMITAPTLDSPPVSRPGFDFDPYLSDPARWGVSMAQVTELIVACLDAARTKSVAEVGAFAGDLTRGACGVGGDTRTRGVQAIDPEPQRGLVELDRGAPPSSS